MRRPWILIGAGVLVAALALTAIALAAGSGGSSPPAAAARPCRPHQPSVSHAPVPSALLAALPVLGRAHGPQDTPPHEAISMLSSLGTGIELDHAQLVRTSPQGGRAWIVPVQHEAPQVVPDLGCLKLTITELARQLPRGGGSGSPLARVLAERRSYLQAAQRFLRTHTAPAPPGVIAFTEGAIVQGADGTLGQIRAGSAFTAGECAGPGGNLLTVSGLAPGGAVSAQLQAPDGATQTQPVVHDAYSFLFAPSPARAGIPDRLVLLDAGQRPLRTLSLPAPSLASDARCRVSGQAQGIPAGYTVIASNPHGPDGNAYTIGVASAGTPDCIPYLAQQETDGWQGGGTRYCSLILTSVSPAPRFDSGGCGSGTMEVNGTVSSAVRRLRFIAPDGQTVTAPVAEVPPDIARDYGVVLAIGPVRVLAANPAVESLSATGSVLATTRPLGGFVSCGPGYRVRELPPGQVTLAHARTPQGPDAILLNRIRFLGRDALCIQQQPQGNQQCANYPIGPTSGQGIGNAPVWVLSGGHGSCTRPRFQLISGVMLRTGLTAWLRTPSGLSRMATAGVPSGYGVPGPLFYAVLRRAPASVVVRAAGGRTVYSRALASGAPGGSCGGLSPNTVG